MASGRTKSKKMYVVFGIVAALIVAAVVILAVLFRKDPVSFEENDKLYFKMFANLWEEDQYEFESLDAYYLSDTGKYYYNAKYSAYIELEEAWSSIDEVRYGGYAKFYNCFCLSWDSLYGFEAENEEFKRAQLEGVHKTYTQSEIEALLATAFAEKAQQEN